MFTCTKYAYFVGEMVKGGFRRSISFSTIHLNFVFPVSRWLGFPAGARLPAFARVKYVRKSCGLRLEAAGAEKLSHLLRAQEQQRQTSVFCGRARRASRPAR